MKTRCKIPSFTDPPARTDTRDRAVLVDWGGTVMEDLPFFPGPMASWPEVRTVEGAEKALRTLHGDHIIALVTNASRSGEREIRAALSRAGLGAFVDRVYCPLETGHRKPSPALFSHVLDDLGLRPERAVMVGDDFETDVLGAAGCGIRAVWLNRDSREIRTGALYRTIHDLSSLPAAVSELLGNPPLKKA